MSTKSWVLITTLSVTAILVISIIIYTQTIKQEPTTYTSTSNILLDIEKAKNFHVAYTGSNKILHDGANRTITLVPITDTRQDGNILIPVSRMIIFSSTHAALIDRLGISDKIVGVAWDGNYEWYIGSIKEGLKNGRIKDVGPSNDPNYDEIVTLKPDLVVLVGGTGLWEKHAKKLDELGINYVVNSEWLEEDPLGRFEWIKFFSLFTNDENKAAEIYSEAKAKTLETSKRVSELERTDVLWAGVFRGSVYIPRAESYAGKIINITNGNYVFNDMTGTGSAQISLEELVLRGNDADILIYSSTTVNKTSDITAVSPLLAELKPIQTCRVYAFQPWYWQTIDRINDYMNDVAAILHPDAFQGYELKQFKKVDCD